VALAGTLSVNEVNRGSDDLLTSKMMIGMLLSVVEVRAQMIHVDGKFQFAAVSNYIRQAGECVVPA